MKKTHSRAGGYYYFSDKSNSTKPPTKPTPNGVHHALYITLRNVMASAAEAELGALFYNGQVAKPIRTCLEEMEYPQPSTTIITYNSTAAGIVNSSIRQKKTKSHGYAVLLGKRLCLPITFSSILGIWPHQ